MNSFLAILGASVTTFAATNIDDLFLLTLFFANRLPTRRIVAGQYLGFAAIIALSLAGTWAALAMSHIWIRLLGTLPLVIGIKTLLSTKRSTSTERISQNNTSLLAIATVTLSNGADNVGAYIPFFIAGRPYLWFILASYFVLLGLWCLAGRWLGGHSLVLKAVDRWGHLTVPFVFIALGIYVLAR
jgi:cadmium resistance protein CadD (predicted permease)